MRGSLSFDLIPKNLQILKAPVPASETLSVSDSARRLTVGSGKLTSERQTVGTSDNLIISDMIEKLSCRLHETCGDRSE